MRFLLLVASLFLVAAPAFSEEPVEPQFSKLLPSGFLYTGYYIKKSGASPCRGFQLDVSLFREGVERGLSLKDFSGCEPRTFMRVGNFTFHSHPFTLGLYDSQTVSIGKKESDESASVYVPALPDVAQVEGHYEPVEGGSCTPVISQSSAEQFTLSECGDSYNGTYQCAKGSPVCTAVVKDVKLRILRAGKSFLWIWSPDSGGLSGIWTLSQE